MSNLNKFGITETQMLALANKNGVEYRFGEQFMANFLAYSQELLSLAAPVASAAPSEDLPPLPKPDMDDWNVQMKCVKALLICTEGELECIGEKLLYSYIADVQRVVAAALASLLVLEELK